LPNGIAIAYEHSIIKSNDTFSLVGSWVVFETPSKPIPWRFGLSLGTYLMLPSVVGVQTELFAAKYFPIIFTSRFDTKSGLQCFIGIVLKIPLPIDFGYSGWL
jgi:hypothetical protein